MKKIDFAISSCNLKSGTVLEEKNFMNPEYVGVLKNKGKLKIHPDTLSIEDAVGKRLTEKVKPLTPFTPNILEDCSNRSNYASKHTLIKKHYRINRVEISDATYIEGKILYIDNKLIQMAIETEALVVDMDLRILTKEQYSEYTETLMDVQPIAVKEYGKLGEGVTRVLDGVVMVLTGTDEKGVQIGEFGSSEGILENKVKWNRPGAPDFGEIILKTEVVIKDGFGMEREGPAAVHRVSEVIMEGIRNALVEYEGKHDYDKSYDNIRQRGRDKILIVKEIMGQGAMHENVILPLEPCAMKGGKSNIDLGNLPIMMSPLEVIDGGIRSMCCIGPSTKETTRHYWREPLVSLAMEDEGINLCGVVVIGSPQVNYDKHYVSGRLGTMIEAMDLDGIIIATEGFGNNHIDFSAHHEQTGKRKIPTVGMTFAGVQGALVTGNEHMGHLVELSKTEDGMENEVLAYNTLCENDAKRALFMLKLVMAGVKIREPEEGIGMDAVRRNTLLMKRDFYDDGPEIACESDIDEYEGLL